MRLILLEVICLAFSAQHILFNGISSERFGLTLYNTNGDLDETDGVSFSVLHSSLHNGQQFVFLGDEPKDPIRLELFFVSETPLDSAMQGAISRWLVGHNGYRELRFVQPDMATLRVGCIFHELRFLQVGNDTVGVVVVGECDSWCFRGNDMYKYIAGESGDFVINNMSDINDYVYPGIVITMPYGGGDFTLINHTDHDRESTFTELAGDEVITLDNFRKIITSSHSLRRLSNFNKKWIRLLPGKNVFSFVFTGGAGNISMDIPVYRMVAR